MGDLSFIPLGLVLPALVRCVKPDADLVMMVKPQFEVGKERLGSGGVVRSTQLRAEAVRGVAEKAWGLGLGVKGVTASPLPGPSGNVEYFLWLRSGAPALDPADVRPCSGGGAALTENRARTVFLLAHTGRPAAMRSAELVVKGLLRSGLGVRVLEAEARDLPLPAEVELVKEATPQCLDGCELLIVLGGDGTLLRGAEFARASGVPMLGVNLGRVGFLAEAERDDLDKVVDRVVTKSYEVEERMTVDVVVHRNGDIVHTDWALNEAAVQKVSPSGCWRSSWRSTGGR